MIPWALQLHHATNPRGSMSHMPGLQGHDHHMPRSMVLLTSLVRAGMDVTGRRTFRKNVPDVPRSQGHGGTQGAEQGPRVAGIGWMVPGWPQQHHCAGVLLSLAQQQWMLPPQCLP